MKIEVSPDKEDRFTVDGNPIVYAIIGRMAYLNDVRKIMPKDPSFVRRDLNRILCFLESQQIPYIILDDDNIYLGIQIFDRDYRIEDILDFA